MAGSAAQAEPRERIIRPERIEAIDAVITALQAQGKAVTNAAVYDAVKGHRADVVGYLKQWRQQQQVAAVPVAPVAVETPTCPLAPVPPPAPFERAVFITH
jgi:Plasmid replication region DNA-binding N-term